MASFAKIMNRNFLEETQAVNTYLKDRSRPPQGGRRGGWKERRRGSTAPGAASGEGSHGNSAPWTGAGCPRWNRELSGPGLGGWGDGEDRGPEGAGRDLSLLRGVRFVLKMSREGAGFAVSLSREGASLGGGGRKLTSCGSGAGRGSVARIDLNLQTDS